MQQPQSERDAQWSAAIEWYVTKNFPNIEVSKVDVERWPQCGCLRLTVNYKGPDGPCQKQVSFDCGEFDDILAAHAASKDSPKH